MPGATANPAATAVPFLRKERLDMSLLILLNNYVCVNKFRSLKLVKVHIGLGSLRRTPAVILALGNVLEEILFHVSDHFLKSLAEFVEIFLVEENLVFVKGEAAVRFLSSLAFGDCEVVVVVALGCLNVEEIRTLAGPDRL